MHWTWHRSHPRGGLRRFSSGRRCRVRVDTIGVRTSTYLMPQHCPSVLGFSWYLENMRATDRSRRSHHGSTRTCIDSDFSDRMSGQTTEEVHAASAPNRGISASRRLRRAARISSLPKSCTAPSSLRRSTGARSYWRVSKIYMNASSRMSRLRRPPHSRWNSATTGVWSEGRSARRGSRSICEATQRFARGVVARIRSIRSP